MDGSVGPQVDQSAVVHEPLDLLWITDHQGDHIGGAADLLESDRSEERWRRAPFRTRRVRAFERPASMGGGWKTRCLRRRDVALPLAFVRAERQVHTGERRRGEARSRAVPRTVPRREDLRGPGAKALAESQRAPTAPSRSSRRRRTPSKTAARAPSPGCRHTTAPSPCRRSRCR